MADPVMIDRMKSFDDNIEEALGTACVESDFPTESLTPVFDYYDDDDGGGLKPVDEDGLEGSADDIPAPEAGDHYVGAKVMLPHGGSLARGRVVRRKRDREGNPSGRASTNPMLDT